MRMIVFAPDRSPVPKDAIKIFLAGSIEMGSAVPWQDSIPHEVDWIYDPIVFYNPRRPDWDWTWEQSIDNPNFLEQVTWEADSIDAADIVLFVFDPATKSPISLMELGYVLGSSHGSKLVVCCPDGFWRQGNVDIMCSRKGVTVHRSLPSALEELNLKLYLIRKKNL